MIFSERPLKFKNEKDDNNIEYRENNNANKYTIKMKFQL